MSRVNTAWIKLQLSETTTTWLPQWPKPGHAKRQNYKYDKQLTFNIKLGVFLPLIAGATRAVCSQGKRETNSERRMKWQPLHLFLRACVAQNKRNGKCERKDAERVECERSTNTGGANLLTDSAFSCDIIAAMLEGKNKHFLSLGK